MINVGREFEMDKSRWRSYTEDYFIAMATAAFPWIFVALYYMFVLLPDIYWNSGEAWNWRPSSPTNTPHLPSPAGIEIQPIPTSEKKKIKESSSLFTNCFCLEL